LCAYPACVPGIALRARRNVSMCRNQPPSVPPASPLAVEYRVDYPPCTGCASFRLIKVAKQLSLSPCVLFDEAVQVVTRPTPVRERLDTFRLEHPSKCDCLAVTVELREWIVPRLDVRVSHSIGRNCCGCKASIHQSLVRVPPFSASHLHQLLPLCLCDSCSMNTEKAWEVFTTI
jgi:hypothetical protein